MNDKNRKAYRILLLGMLLISSLSSQKELREAIFKNGIYKGNRCAPYSTLTELMKEFDPAIYQYVDWNAAEGINRWIIQ